VEVHLVDGTYELFRHFYAPGMPQDLAVGDRSAVRGVLGTLLRMLEEGVTHLGLATDHVIESFRNDLWPGYKTGDGIDPRLLDQFHPLEESAAAMGIRVWPMVEFEADDALASAAVRAAADARVTRVVIWTPDKDLGQCVSGDRVVQIERRSGTVRNEAVVLEKFGVPPASIPDWLALVGDAADGYPGLPGWGAKTAAAVLRRWHHIDAIPERPQDWDVAVRGAAQLSEVLNENRPVALLFRTLATLRLDVPVFEDVNELRWRGARADFAGIAQQLGAAGLRERASALAAGRAPVDAPATRLP
jgi:5'-3' exonuclease